MPSFRRSPRVKICGITNLADAQAAAAAGADYFGFVFIPRSSRYVTPEELTSWWSELPQGAQASQAPQAPQAPKKVALFQNATAAAVESVLNRLEVDVLQFHGDESPEFCSQFGLPYWKSVGLPLGGSAVGESFTKATIDYPAAQALVIDAVTTDACGQKISGGTGKQFDWALWPHWFARGVQTEAQQRLVLAGGLDPTNVAAAVVALNPSVVDVSSGVEASPGKKDAQKLSDFCTAVKSATQTSDSQTLLHNAQD